MPLSEEDPETLILVVRVKDKDTGKKDFARVRVVE